MRHITAKLIFLVLQIAKVAGLIYAAVALRKSRIFSAAGDAPEFDRVLWYIVVVDIVGFIEVTLSLINFATDKRIIWVISYYMNVLLTTKLVVASIFIPEIDKWFTITGSVVCFSSMIVTGYIRDAMKHDQDILLLSERTRLIQA